MVEARKSCATSEVDGILQNSAIARQIMGDRGRCKEIVGGKNGEEWGIRACRSCNGDTPTGRRRSGPTMDVVPNDAQPNPHPPLEERDSAE